MSKAGSRPTHPIQEGHLMLAGQAANGRMSTNPFGPWRSSKAAKPAIMSCINSHGWPCLKGSAFRADCQFIRMGTVLRA
ncbi:hypothetical protein Nepgr_012301 [Nepenthes gracilis]|uniref:Uncharacterized protein n=1 Tax=Nepenthes gracilis TaxID=150966 RepID=A0AAD3SFH2_NEPGR|nr:hypothetical protein Nepgr_012301 [Nepenthes gracilis]